MDNKDIREILKTKLDLDLFDEYSKYITIGVMARNGVHNVQEHVIADGVFKQALALVEERKRFKKILAEKDSI